MVQSPFWEANWFAASQEIPRISRNPKVLYRTHKRPPPVPILGQPNPVHIPISHLLRSVLILSTHLRLGLPQWSLSLRFPHQDPIYPPLLTHTRHNCAWHIRYRNTYANINTSHHKGMVSIKNVRHHSYISLFFKLQTPKPTRTFSTGANSKCPGRKSMEMRSVWIDQKWNNMVLQMYTHKKYSTEDLSRINREGKITYGMTKTCTYIIPNST